MDEAVLGRADAQASLFTRVTGVPCVVLERTGAMHYPLAPADYPCRLCRTISGERPHEEPEGARHLKWVEEAIRFGGRSIFMCGNAFTHWTSPILDEGRLVGALVAGPVLTIDEEDFFENELLARFSGEQLPSVVENLQTLFTGVSRLPPARVTTYSELLLELCNAISRPSNLLHAAEESLAQQSRIGEYVQELKARRTSAGEDPNRPTYPVEKETSLLSQIRSGEIQAAQKSLNELLSHVFFASGSDMKLIKMRSRELVVLLSRAVLTEGAEPEEVFGLNYQFVDAIDHQDDLNGVAFWMARIVRRFADLILYLPHLGHARAMRRAITHIRTHLAEPLRVRDVAGVSGLSPGHFSRVFHEEMGETFVNYVNRLRCEQAGDLLRTTNLPVQEIAHRCGFGDHSYFTKVFRTTMGVSPTTHRGG